MVPALHWLQLILLSQLALFHLKLLLIRLDPEHLLNQKILLVQHFLLHLLSLLHHLAPDFLLNQYCLSGPAFLLIRLILTALLFHLHLLIRSFP